MSKYQRLTDDQWAILEPLLANEASSVRGRPPVHDDRSVLNGILWVLRTGAAWADLPERFPSSSTCYRRFSKWVKTGVFRKILEALARDLEERGAINLSECFIDGTFVVAKKGAQKWERPSGGKVRSSWLLQTLLVFHSPCTRSAGPHEVTLVQAALDEIVTVGQPRRIIGDRAYDSDPLDNALAAQGIEMIAPHRRNRKRKATQDGRPLRRYRRRWKIERLFAWLNTFKRTMARWDRFHQHFTAFVHLAFSMILLRRVIKEL